MHATKHTPKCGSPFLIIACKCIRGCLFRTAQYQTSVVLCFLCNQSSAWDSYIWWLWSHQLWIFTVYCFPKIGSQTLHKWAFVYAFISLHKTSSPSFSVVLMWLGNVTHWDALMFSINSSLVKWSTHSADRCDKWAGGRKRVVVWQVNVCRNMWGVIMPYLSLTVSRSTSKQQAVQRWGDLSLTFNFTRAHHEPLYPWATVTTCFGPEANFCNLDEVVWKLARG